VRLSSQKGRGNEKARQGSIERPAAHRNEVGRMSSAKPGARALPILLATISGLALSASATAEDLRPSVNLYGQSGLIDMPSAEMQPDGEITASYSYFGGQQRRNLTFQVLPRVSGTLRYSTVDNFGRVEDGVFDPNYDLFDRSFDLSFQLLRDTGRWQPSLTVGLRDMLGTGIYAGEYVVASKRVTEDITVTGGIGWGRLGTLGGFSNPICDLFGGGACERQTDFGEGGNVAWDNFFQGETAAFFGGIEWRTPIEGFTLKAEYSPDAYQPESEGSQPGAAADFERKSRFNFGAEYRVLSGVTVGGYYMYGNYFGANVAVTANPNRPITPQDLGTGPLPVGVRPADAPRGTGWASNPAAVAQLGAALEPVLEQEGMRLREIRATGNAVEVAVVNRRFARDPQAIGRTARVLQTALPASVEVMKITVVRDGLPVTTVAIDRAAYEALIDRPDAGQRMWERAVITSADPDPGETTVWQPTDAFPTFEWSVYPAPYLVYLTPGDPIRFALNIDGSATYRVNSALSLTGAISQPFLGVRDDPGPSDSNLPPVRSETARYFAGWEPNVTRLTGDYVSKVGPAVYVRASGGYLERMFAGVSGEVLWKPSEQSWGLGVELNYVAQRDNDGFGFSEYDYEVATGHASLYWDTGIYDFEVQVDAGRYLAGDWGSTLRLTRRFPNGWAVGAYATVTDVTSEDFGEGSFDKGITLEIPFRWTTPFETRAKNSLELRSISRDGGARLDVANRLYPTVRDLDRNRLARNWGAFWQ
jgi:hypothetical protein